MIQNTLFYKYISEREGKRIIEDERGFIVYKINGADCFIAEAFVDESARGTSAGMDLVRHLKAEAQAEGCKTISGTVWVNAKGSMRALRSGLKMGFKIVAAENDALLLVMEV